MGAGGVNKSELTFSFSCTLAPQMSPPVSQRINGVGSGGSNRANLRSPPRPRSHSAVLQVVEIAPAFQLDPHLRDRLHADAVSLARQVRDVSTSRPQKPSSYSSRLVLTSFIKLISENFCGKFWWLFSNWVDKITHLVGLCGNNVKFMVRPQVRKVWSHWCQFISSKETS